MPAATGQLRERAGERDPGLQWLKTAQPCGVIRCEIAARGPVWSRHLSGLVKLFGDWPPHAEHREEQDP